MASSSRKTNKRKHQLTTNTTTSKESIKPKKNTSVTISESSPATNAKKVKSKKDTSDTFSESIPTTDAKKVKSKKNTSDTTSESSPATNAKKVKSKKDTSDTISESIPAPNAKKVKSKKKTSTTASETIPTPNAKRVKSKKKTSTTTSESIPATNAKKVKSKKNTSTTTSESNPTANAKKPSAKKYKSADNISIQKGEVVECIISSISTGGGLHVKLQSSSSSLGYIDGLEISQDIKIVQDLSKKYSVGSCIKAKIIEQQPRAAVVNLSILQIKEDVDISTNPKEGDIVIGRINRHVNSVSSPSLMLDLRGGKDSSMARCCITELFMNEDWKDMPLGTFINNNKKKNEEEKDFGLFPHGRYVQIRILLSEPTNNRTGSTYECSLQLKQNSDNTPKSTPKVNDVVQGYVINTNKKRSMIRLSSTSIGSAWIKNISDRFVKNPDKFLPQGKLVKAKIIKIEGIDDKVRIHLDLKKSISENIIKPSNEKIKAEKKYKGVVSRVESYGIFVKLQQQNNKSMTAMAHISECSDKYVKDLNKVYTIGDLVKAYVLKVDKNKIAISLKATHFQDDDDSSSDDDDDDSNASSSAEEDNERIIDQFIDDSDDDDEDEIQELLQADENELDIDSIDDISDSNSSGASDDDDSVSSENIQDSSSSLKDNSSLAMMDTDFGFDWDMPSSSSKQQNNNSNKDDDESSSDESSSDASNDPNDDKQPRNTHKSRKNAAKKQRLEKQITLREQALADGTADLHPETISDLERLITSNPDLSQHYIKYMAYYLSCSDIDAARNIARRALARIDFRKENEKLNIWTALLALESKYGTDVSFDTTLQKACERNNPKYVYLRVCEMLQREVETNQYNDTTDVQVSTPSSSSESSTTMKKATTMFQKMCKRFRTKKTVWTSFFQFLLQNNLAEEAHLQLKQSLLSLPKYKHITVVSKYAQFEYDYGDDDGSIERGRTIFDALIESNPKRIDLLFLYIDKEIKLGNTDTARSIFRKVVSSKKEDKMTVFKYNDNQMKRLFKKWYSMEESCTKNESYCEDVKIAAKDFVTGTMS